MKIGLKEEENNQTFKKKKKRVSALKIEILIFFPFFSAKMG